MLHCLTLKPSTSSSPTAARDPASLQDEGNSSELTPRECGTNAVSSPIVNLTHEYALAVQTSSYNEIRSKIHVVEQWEGDEPNHQQQLLLAQVLQPNHDLVQEALQHARPSTFTQLVSTYFEHSEKTCHLLLMLQQRVHQARSLYAPVHDLVDALPTDTDSLTQWQCNHAFEVLLQFSEAGHPFPCSDSDNFQDTRRCFSQLKQQVDNRLRKSRDRVRLVRCATASSAICLIGTVVGVAISAIFIAAHALVALVAASSICPAYIPFRFTKREIVHTAQLDAAAKSAYVLHNDLDTIDRLVARVYTVIEGDRRLICLGLSTGKDKHPICEVMKQLGNNRIDILDHLVDLEEHICLCFAAINRARSLLIQEIYLHQTDSY